MSTKIQLKNGLKVLLLESHKSPVVSVQMWVKTGSVDEDPKVAGISHFIEHLVFKGTQKYKMGEIASAVEANGGELNAYTSFDQTVFYVTISNQFSHVALDVVSQMMGFPLFDPQEIDNEREVVIEEIKRGKDSPNRRASQLLFTNVFKKHYYGRPVIGYEKVIQSVTPKQIKNYYHSRYVPRNMFLVIAGDFDSKTMKKNVHQYFDNFISYPLKKISRKKEPPQKSPRIKIEVAEFQQSTCYISWRIPNVKHKDIIALDVLSLILGQGDSSRLVTKLRIQEPICNSIGCFAYSMQDDGLLAISLGLEKENLSKSLYGIKEALLLALTEKVTEEELQKAVTNLASQEIYSLETVDSIARKSGSYEFYLGDHEYYKKYLKELYKLTPDEILAVAKKYIRLQSTSISYLTNDKEENAKKLFKQFLVEFKNDLKKTKVKIPFKKIKKTKSISLDFKPIKTEPKTEKIVLPNGVKIFLREQKDSPLVSVKLGFLGGVRIEPKGKEGLVDLFSKTWMSNTKKYNEEQINLIIDQQAAAMSPFAGRNSVGIGADYLSQSEPFMLDLLAEVLTEPRFSEVALEREKTISLNKVKARHDNPSQLCMINFFNQMFSGHPYAKDMLGTEKSILSIGKEHLEAYYNRAIHTENMNICVVGDIQKKLWISEIENISKYIKSAPVHNEKFALSPLNEEKIIRANLKKEQSHIMIGYRGLTLTSPDRYTLDVINAILSGQGGRLFLELRDKKSLAYSVSPMSMLGLDTGYFGGYIGCSPEKTEVAIKMLKQEFQRLATEKVGQLELERAQRYLVGSHDIDLQRKSAICNTILFDEIYGLNSDESLHVAKKYYSVTADNILSLSQKIFDSPAVISIV